MRETERNEWNMNDVTSEGKNVRGLLAGLG